MTTHTIHNRNSTKLFRIFRTHIDELYVESPELDMFHDQESYTSDPDKYMLLGKYGKTIIYQIN